MADYSRFPDFSRERNRATLSALTDCFCSAGVLTKRAAAALANRVASVSDDPSTNRATNAPMKVSPAPCVSTNVTACAASTCGARPASTNAKPKPPAVTMTLSTWFDSCAAAA
jgi:hypothetical protein